MANDKVTRKMNRFILQFSPRLNSRACLRHCNAGSERKIGNERRKTTSIHRAAICAGFSIATRWWRSSNRAYRLVHDCDRLAYFGRALLSLQPKSGALDPSGRPPLLPSIQLEGRSS